MNNYNNVERLTVILNQAARITMQKEKDLSHSKQKEPER